MSEAGFTPGPWRVVEYGDGDSLVIHDARGDWRVCFMATPSKDGDFEGIEANARLIAAAPDMFEALAEVVAAMRKYEMVVDADAPAAHREMMRKADSALSRARGEAE